MYNICQGKLFTRQQQWSGGLHATLAHTNIAGRRDRFHGSCCSCISKRHAKALSHSLHSSFVLGMHTWPEVGRARVYMPPAIAYWHRPVTASSAQLGRSWMPKSSSLRALQFLSPLHIISMHVQRQQIMPCAQYAWVWQVDQAHIKPPEPRNIEPHTIVIIRPNPSRPATHIQQGGDLWVTPNCNVAPNRQHH